MTTSHHKGTVTVIGGGIIGLCSAYYLVNEGFQVTILDQGDLKGNCSSGNAGMIVPSHFIPLAAPGMISKGIKWMFNSRSPFYVKPSLSWSLISWGLKFMQHATEKHVENSALPLRDIHLLSKQLYSELAAVPPFNFGLEDKGILMLYKTEGTGEEEIHVAEKAKSLGLEVDILNAKEVNALEPHTSLDVLGAVHYKCDSHLYPNALIDQLIEYLRIKGVTFHTHTRVTGFEEGAGKIKKVYCGDQHFASDLVVMTGGAWLPSLASSAGLNIPVMPGKGYSFMVDNTPRVQHPSLLLEARVAVTPMNGHIRFGGTMEIAPIRHQINRKRVEGIVDSIPRYYPEIKASYPEPSQIWHGFRPASPDGLPYLGYSQKMTNLIIAGGHGMMGLSLGPASGKIVSELALNKSPQVSIEAYRPDRFQ